MMSLSLVWVMGGVFVIFCGLWSFISYHKHLLNSLLSLEYMVLGGFWLFSMQFMGIGMEVYFVLFFLTMVVCEGVLGLSLLVFVVRSYGNDQFSSMSILEC